MISVNFQGFYEYIETGKTELFTVVLMPDRNDKFPIVIIRSPYVDNTADMDENKIVTMYLCEYKRFLSRGYGVVLQHCRGRGKSTGDCVPYINEREDGLQLLDWIRKLDFYNGELYLHGASYLTSVHYAISPFPEDIKGAVLKVQDCERYNICYRNGMLKKGLHCGWYVGMYKHKTLKKKNYTPNSFNILPLSDFSKTVFGEHAEDFDEMIKHPNKADDFWNTRWGGDDARDAIKDADIPILLETGFYDIYTGGIFDMWNTMSEDTKNKCALIVSPYDHGDGCKENNSIVFKNGKRCEQFGSMYDIDWLDAIRGQGEYPFERGKITYYTLFENVWKTDDFAPVVNESMLTLGRERIDYVYNPYDAPEFIGGLSCNFDGAQYQDKPDLRYDIISIYTEPFQKDILVKGKMKAKLTVQSDCEDTCFYMRISIEKEHGDFGLRDDITSICYQKGNYTPNEKTELSFSFDEHSFLIRKDERLRIDISSADNAHYVRHTNRKGLYSEQTYAKIAHNSVYLDESCLYLPVEE